MAARRCLLTRPRGDSERLAKELAVFGVNSAIAPMIEIVRDPAARLDLDGVQALLVTSANGVRALAATTPRRDMAALAVGRASAAAARREGFEDVTAAGGDVASLAKLAISRCDPKAGALLHVSGADVAGDLEGQLEREGFDTRRTVLYRAVAAEGFAPEIRRDLALGGFDGVVFFSPRTAARFVMLAKRDAVAEACAGLIAFCLSPAVGDAAAGLAWRAIRIAKRPDREAMIARIIAEEPE